MEVDLSFIKNDKTFRFLIGDLSRSSIIHKIELKSNPLSKYFDVARGLPNNKVNFNSNSHYALKSTNVRKYRIEGELLQVGTKYHIDFIDEPFLSIIQTKDIIFRLKDQRQLGRNIRTEIRCIIHPV